MNSLCRQIGFVLFAVASALSLHAQTNSPKLPENSKTSTINAVNVVFCGDSITWGGGGIANAGTMLRPTMSFFAVQELRRLTGIAPVFASNQGHNGHTTTDWLPGSEDLAKAKAAMSSLIATHPSGAQVFSFLLGTNDSAATMTNNSPYHGRLPAEAFRSNLETITNHLLLDFPDALIVWNEAPYYSANTRNGAIYEQEGLALLYDYRDATEQALAQLTTVHPGHVFLGDTAAFAYFAANYQSELVRETGPNGIFYLHPSGKPAPNGRIGTQSLGQLDARAIAHALTMAGLISRVSQKPIVHPQTSEGAGSLPVMRGAMPPAFEQYPLRSDPLSWPGVARAKVFDSTFYDAKIFANTAHRISVDAPAEYKADNSTCSSVFLDASNVNARMIFRQANRPTCEAGYDWHRCCPSSSANALSNPRFDSSFKFHSMISV